MVSVFENRDFFEVLTSNKEIIVSSTDLKKYGGREPRLMAKIDTREELPSIFKKFNISLLPIQNKQYLLFIDDSKNLFYDFPILKTPVITKFQMRRFPISKLYRNDIFHLNQKPLILPILLLF